MKLAILNLVAATPDDLRPWSTDEDCLVLPAKPIQVLQSVAWRNLPLEPVDIERFTLRHLQQCQVLFDWGEQDRGPRTIGTPIGFLAASDFSLFLDSRFPLALLDRLGEICHSNTIERIEVVGDQSDNRLCWIAVQEFAAARGIFCRRKTLMPSKQGLAQRAAANLAERARRGHPAGPAIARYLKNWLARPVHRNAPSRRDPDSRTLSSCVEKVRAAMLVYHPKSWRYLLPIRKALLAAGHEAILISPRRETDQVLELAGVPFTSLPHTFPRLGLFRDVAQCAEVLPLASGGGAPGFQPDMIRPERNIFKRLALEMAMLYGDVAGQLAEIFDRERINLILGTDSGSVAGRSFFRSAERLGILSVFVQHGALVQGPYVARYFTDARILAWGESSRDNLIASGIPHPERIASIGSPYQEEVLAGVPGLAHRAQSPTANCAAAILVTFGVPGGFVPEASFLPAVWEVFDAAQSLPQIEFVIKPHPGDQTRVWEDAQSRRKLANTFIRRDADTYELMRSCRALVTMFSTTGAEAIWMGKPVVSVNFDRRDAGLDYITFGAAYTVESPGALAELLQSLVETPPGTDRLAKIRQRFADHFLHREERPAADRIVDYLEDLVPQRAAAGECVKF